MVFHFGYFTQIEELQLKALQRKKVKPLNLQTLVLTCDACNDFHISCLKLFIAVVSGN